MLNSYKGGKPKNVQVEDGYCFVPSELEIGAFELCLRGDDGESVVASANRLTFEVCEGFDPSGETPLPPSPDLYTQLIKEIDSGKKIAQSVRDDADAGLFNGKRGADGGWYTPSVKQTDENTLRMAFTPSKDDMPDVAHTDITLPGGGGGTSDHSKLSNRNAANQHPMSAITGLEAALGSKQPAGEYLTEETDPTVPDWAKEPTKPSYTAAEVGADPSGTAAAQVSTHNTGEAAHSDIRLLIQGLTDRINALADSDDTTLDQLSEIVAYIKSNRDLISSITTSKVSVTDIVDDLVTSVADKPLSAAQGVALKALIDAISVPAATAEDAGKVPVVQADGSYGLGSMVPAPETAEIGQTIVVTAVDENGKPTEWEMADLPKPDEYVVLFHKTFEAAVANTDEWGGESHQYSLHHYWTVDTDGNAVYADGIFFRIHVPAQTDNIVSSGELIVRVGQCAVTDWNSWNANEPKPYVGWASFVPATGQEVWAEQNFDLREQILSGAKVTNQTYQGNFNGANTVRAVPFSYALGRRNIEYLSGIQISLNSGSLPAGTEILIYARKYDANKIKNIPKWGAT